MAMRRGLARAAGTALRLLGAVAVVLALLAPALVAPALLGARSAVAAERGFPGNTRSHYLTTLSADVLGRTAQQDAADARRVGIAAALVVLDAGSPAGRDGSVRLPDSGRHASADAVATAAIAYGRQWQGSHGPRLLLVVGTTNYGSFVAEPHGGAWGRLVATVAAALPEVDVRGGLDAEMEWGTPSATLAWQRGFLHAGRQGLVDFGSCTCPPLATPSHHWTVATRWAVATAGGRGVVLPQVYATAGGNATEWAALVRWSRAHRPERPVRLIGVLTEVSACTGPPRRSCAGIDAAPRTAWRQLAAALGSAAGLTYASDIGYLPRPGPVSGPLTPVGGKGGLSGIVVAALLAGAGAAVLLGRRRVERVRRRSGSGSRRTPSRRRRRSR